MKSIDVVIVSDAKNYFLQSLTQIAIDTAIENENILSVKVIVVEKQELVEYANCKNLKQTGEFSYNKYLNYGASFGDSEYISFCNNDLVFGHNWASEIIHEMIKENVSSASPYCHLSNIKNGTEIKQRTGNHFGHEVRREICGWCFVWKRDLWNKIKLDERLAFWASDNSFAQQLIHANERHMLSTTSFVSHLSNGSNSLNSMQEQEKNLLMQEQVRKFNRLYDKNLFELGTDIYTSDDVTVIIPVCGDINYWKPLYERAQNSVLNQTKKSKYCIISFANDLQSARNTTGNQAHTKWILFCDADDELYENYIEEMLKCEGDIIVPSAHRYFADGTIDKSNKWYEPKDLLTCGNFIVIGAMIRADLFRKLGGFKNLQALEDYDFFLRAEESGAKFTHCPKAIYKINVRENSRNVDQSIFPQIVNEAKKRRGIL